MIDIRGGGLILGFSKSGNKALLGGGPCVVALVAIGEFLGGSSGEVGEVFDVLEMIPDEDEEEDDTSTMQGADFSLEELLITVNFCVKSFVWSVGVFEGVGALSCSPLVPSLSLTGFLEGGDKSSMEVSKERSLFL